MGLSTSFPTEESCRHMVLQMIVLPPPRRVSSVINYQPGKSLWRFAILDRAASGIRWELICGLTMQCFGLLWRKHAPEWNSVGIFTLTNYSVLGINGWTVSGLGSGLLLFRLVLLPCFPQPGCSRITSSDTLWVRSRVGLQTVAPPPKKQPGLRLSDAHWLKK